MFKSGDILIPKPYYQGFEKLVIKDHINGYYNCKIVNGIVSIKDSVVEENYNLHK